MLMELSLMPVDQSQCTVTDEAGTTIINEQTATNDGTGVYYV